MTLETVPPKSRLDLSGAREALIGASGGAVVSDKEPYVCAEAGQAPAGQPPFR